MYTCIHCAEPAKLWFDICDDCYFSLTESDGQEVMESSGRSPAAQLVWLRRLESWERAMVNDLTGRARSALDGLRRELYFRNRERPDIGLPVSESDLAAYVDDGYIDGLTTMAYSLRRPDDFVQMEGHRQYRDEERGGWAHTARFDVTTAQLLLESLTREATSKIEPARKRFIDMLELAVYSNVSPRAADYLARVARLYIWGFDQELIPMARSVIESATEALIEASGGVARAEGRFGRPIRGVGEKIDCCGPRHLALLSHEATRLAHNVRIDANSVLHEFAPLSERHHDSLAVIKSLVLILGEAFPEARDDLGVPLSPTS